MSTTWYTWLEQGRPIRASASALGRIAEALQLSRAERLYLFEIARCVVPDSSEPNPLEIPAGLKDLVDQMPIPVYVLDRQWNALAWNGRAAKLFRPWLVESEERNLLRFVFLHRRARTLIVDWQSRAKRHRRGDVPLHGDAAGPAAGRTAAHGEQWAGVLSRALRDEENGAGAE